MALGAGAARRHGAARAERRDAGSMPLRQALLAQYDAHKSWSAKLHHDNLAALAETRSELRPVPSYTTVRRFLRLHGLNKRRPLTTRQTGGALAAGARRALYSECAGGRPMPSSIRAMT